VQCSASRALLTGARSQGHTSSMYCVKFLPQCDNSQIISCASDRQARRLCCHTMTRVTGGVLCALSPECEARVLVLVRMVREKCCGASVVADSCPAARCAAQVRVMDLHRNASRPFILKGRVRALEILDRSAPARTLRCRLCPPLLASPWHGLACHASLCKSKSMSSSPVCCRCLAFVACGALREPAEARPAADHFVAGSEDGTVRQFDLREAPRDGGRDDSDGAAVIGARPRLRAWPRLARSTVALRALTCARCGQRASRRAQASRTQACSCHPGLRETVAHREPSSPSTCTPQCNTLGGCLSAGWDVAWSLRRVQRLPPRSWGRAVAERGRARRRAQRTSGGSAPGRCAARWASTAWPWTRSGPTCSSRAAPTRLVRAAPDPAQPLP